MPGMNGLELLELCSHLPSSPSFIILSGYNHFEYVRTAMRYGAVNYLLKPVEQEELIHTIMSTVQLLDDAHTHKRQFQEGIALLQNDVLMRILTNRIENPELREKCNFVNLSFRCSNMRVGLLKALSPKSTITWERTDFSSAELCKTICNAHCSVYTAMDVHDNFILIFKDYTGQMEEPAFSQLLENCAFRLSRQLDQVSADRIHHSCDGRIEINPSDYREN